MAMQKHHTYALWIIIGWIVVLTIGTVIWTIVRDTSPATDSRSATSSTDSELPEPTDPFASVAEPQPPALFQYIEITEGCWPFLGADCVNAYSAPATTSAPLKQLRKGTVLQVGEEIETDTGIWYKITFSNEWIRYPERVPANLYVHASSTRSFLLEEPQELDDTTYQTLLTATTSYATEKHIIIDRSDQTLTAYAGTTVFLEEHISTGLNVTPTPRGEFIVFRKTPSRYMQGPLPGISAKYYDLPGVPWNLYFTKQGGAIHGTYWHDSFGKQYSSGCVNMPLATAQKLYEWAELGTRVIVRD